MLETVRYAGAQDCRRRCTVAQSLYCILAEERPASAAWCAADSWNSTTPIPTRTPTRPTRIYILTYDMRAISSRGSSQGNNVCRTYDCSRVGRVGVGVRVCVGAVECQLYNISAENYRKRLDCVEVIAAKHVAQVEISGLEA